MDELLSEITCALTHDMRTCETCRKCEGKDFAEIRINLKNKLERYFELKEASEEIAEKLKKDYEYPFWLKEKEFNPPIYKAPIFLVLENKPAKDMFKELGYELTNEDGFLEYTKTVGKDYYTIVFHIKNKETYYYTSSGYTDDFGWMIDVPMWLSIEGNKAVIKQMHELGWI